MSLSSMLGTHLITLRRPLITMDNSGGNTREFYDVPGCSFVSVTIQPVDAREQANVLAQRQVQISHWVFCDRDLHPQRDDVVLVPRTGQLFRVTGFGDEGGRGICFLISVIEVAY